MLDDTVTIRTADDPPVELEASRAVLVVGSKVFADMVSLPQSASADASFDVDETEAQIKPFLRLLNITHAEGDPLTELLLEDWPIVARLADKYDSASVKGLALYKYWELEKKVASPHIAFEIAVTLGLAPLVKAPLFRIMHNHNVYYQDALARERKASFDEWLIKLKLHAFECWTRQDLPAITHQETMQRHAWTWEQRYRDTAPDFPM